MIMEVYRNEVSDELVKDEMVKGVIRLEKLYCLLLGFNALLILLFMGMVVKHKEVGVEILIMLGLVTSGISGVSYMIVSDFFKIKHLLQKSESLFG
jgi:hypothetical protein